MCVVRVKFDAAMAFSCSYNSVVATYDYRFPTFSSSLSSFRSNSAFLPCSFLKTLRPSRRKYFLKINATATLDSGNGAVSVAKEVREQHQSSTDEDSYGSRYFPLAAVVGPVNLVNFQCHLRPK